MISLIVNHGDSHWCAQIDTLGHIGLPHIVFPSSLKNIYRIYRIWCVVNRLGDSGVPILGETSAFVNPAGQLLLTRLCKTTMDGVGIVFEFYIL